MNKHITNSEFKTLITKLWNAINNAERIFLITKIPKEREDYYADGVLGSIGLVSLASFVPTDVSFNDDCVTIGSKSSTPKITIHFDESLFVLYFEADKAIEAFTEIVKNNAS